MQPKSRRIVIKFGSGMLTKPSGVSLDEEHFERLAHGISGLRSAGHQVIVVSSGAVAAGTMAFGMAQRPSDTVTQQACAAVGQTRLMHLYERLLRERGLLVAQLLLTNEDFEQPTRRANLENTLRRLLDFGNVVPIINENDSVAVEELKVGDNDRLSSNVAQIARADLLVLLTSVDGLETGGGDLIEVISDVDEALAHVRAEMGAHSVGGMASKLEAARSAVRAGIEVVIANGRRTEQLLELASGSGRGTRLPAMNFAPASD
ncbi:MAG: glutamate 5-kinase [Verrucomicrobiales bacterium]